MAFPFLCLLLRPFLCFLSPGRVQVAEGFALSVVACVLRRQLRQKSKFCFVMGTKKELGGKAVSILCYNRDRAAAKGRAQWCTCVARQTLESRTDGFLGERRVLNMDSRVILPSREKYHLPFHATGLPKTAVKSPALQCDSRRN